MSKPWYKSKTKVGGVLIGGGMILTAVGKVLTGELDGGSAMTSIIAGAGIIFVATGLRDAISPK